ncbi:MAG: glycoside hydrolase family 99-like domain-containing protein [Planctomycetes bacterium]|nr:glycoside hydrolase family 99-like domain-containing protein [Planctomycetota bacterium]
MSSIEVAAYYFPNFHRDARNDAWHGPGWTEWELVRAARPRYPGHCQPIEPAWGCFDEADPAWAAREIDLAADHGITAFFYDYYWYEDGPFLEAQLEHGFLQAPNRRRLKFALMWANHDWLDIHPAKHVNRPQTLARGALSPEAFRRFTDHAIARYFGQPNHLLIDGCPYFTIYELGTFIAGMGGIEGAVAAIDDFRARVRAAGFPGLHLNVSVWSVCVLPSERAMGSRAQLDALRRLGVASAGTYAWAHCIDWSRQAFPRGSYAAAAEDNYAAWERYRASLPVPYQPNVSMGWDPSPRTVQSDGYGPCGYPFTSILDGNSPRAFAAALRCARDFVAGQAHPLVTLNAWNEWTEGSYLLPDIGHGTAYLEQVRAVFGAG